MACVSRKSELDHTDRRILAVLEGNARTSAAEIGRRIGLSRTAVQDRLSKLEASGVISGYRVQVAEARDDMIRAVLFVKISARPCDPALNWMASLEGVLEVISLSGELDALVRCTVPNVAALTALNDKVGANDLIANSKSSVVLKVSNSRP
ncbi:Lrp/AsnC family transcriptional regulator [uncultured Litoreibacter sp.]|uniref:Lrp/AsnC family transcriptional regulator n=1 Tax=uncultured Litoreibacter sp. TaxID=1392394 RepID=UPI00261BAD12|nr:Lrp/AsnC family transcriptional regulator [uncultured Litoreibacter sp.]